MNKLNLAQEINILNGNIVKLINRQSLTRIFISGIIYGLGSVIGATILVAIVAFMLRNVHFVPVIGEWISQIMQHASSTKPN